MKAVVLFFTTVFIAQFCFAHEDEWKPVSAGPATTWTAPICTEGKFTAQPFFFYNRTRGTFDSSGHYSALPDGDKKSQYQQQLFIQYGVTDKFEADGQAVYQENFRRQNGNNAHSEGFGDSFIFLRYCAIEEKEWLPQVTGLFQLKFPTGKYQGLDPAELGTDSMGPASGGGSYDHGYGVILTKKIRPFLLHADALYSFPIAAKVDGVRTKYGNYTNYDFAAEYFLTNGFNLEAEFNGFIQNDKKQEYLIFSPGIGWSCDKVQTLLAYQRVLTGKNTDANDSVVFAFVYIF